MIVLNLKRKYLASKKSVLLISMLYDFALGSNVTSESVNNEKVWIRRKSIDTMNKHEVMKMNI
jgi:hypothetical protein